MPIKVFRFYTTDCKNINYEIVEIESSFVSAIWLKNGKVIPLINIGKLYYTSDKEFYMYSFDYEPKIFLQKLERFVAKDVRYYSTKLQTAESRLKSIKAKMVTL